jgi:hypothetical protein
LHNPLWDWLKLNVDPDVLGRITTRARADATVLKTRAKTRKRSGYVTNVEVLYELVGGQPAGLLDLADLVLAVEPRFPHTIGQLEAVLANANSVWRVSDDASCLVRRVPAPVAHTVTAAVAVGGPNSGTHLDAAWSAAFARRPDTTRAYSEAIKAVEAAAIPVVVPHAAGKEKDQISKATLSWVTRVLREQATDWSVAIPPGTHQRGIDTIITMLELLWEGQKDRHGGVSNTPPPTEDAARSAVQLGVLLVQWFADGTIRRR